MREQVSENRVAGQESNVKREVSREIGGELEEEAAEYIRKHFKKPVVGFIAGQNAPPGRRMGHAGAVISRDSGSPQAKMEALRTAGAVVIENPADMGPTIKRISQERKGI